MEIFISIRMESCSTFVTLAQSQQDHHCGKESKDGLNKIEIIMATIKVTKEKCEKCLYGYPCTMWNELSLPLEGEICNNYEDRL